MQKIKLSYFDFHGGRGEPARLALSIAGIPFEDDRVPGADCRAASRVLHWKPARARGRRRSRHPVERTCSL